MIGDNEFDLVFDVQNYAAQMLDGEYFVDLDSQKYINLDKPYYNQTVRANMANDYVHFTSGQFALANVKNTFAIYFNDELYKSLGKTEDLYALVDSDKWTLDALDKLTKDVYADLDGSTDRSLVPEYCEVTLKTRYSQDEDVSRMFDLIINSIIYDPGEIYSERRRE